MATSPKKTTTAPTADPKETYVKTSGKFIFKFEDAPSIPADLFADAGQKANALPFPDLFTNGMKHRGHVFVPKAFWAERQVANKAGQKATIDKDYQVAKCRDAFNNWKKGTGK